mmetsp:Transcript_30134/g.63024  ORF Transcript_30134/g.63024 Transcript_30134/m.63024 type:complete len:166 (+) Transcript_30134:220-717(+)
MILLHRSIIVAANDMDEVGFSFHHADGQNGGGGCLVLLSHVFFQWREKRSECCTSFNKTMEAESNDDIFSPSFSTQCATVFHGHCQAFFHVWLAVGTILIDSRISKKLFCGPIKRIRARRSHAFSSIRVPVIERKRERVFSILSPRSRSLSLSSYFVDPMADATR